jgi:hypothetical protein
MIDFSKQTCMLCSNTGLQFVSKLRDDDMRFAAECPSCGHVQIVPLPSIEEDNEFYQKNEMTRRLIPKTQMDDEQMMFKYEVWGEEQCKLVSALIPPPRQTMYHKCESWKSEAGMAGLWKRCESKGIRLRELN